MQDSQAKRLTQEAAGYRQLADELQGTHSAMALRKLASDCERQASRL